MKPCTGCRHLRVVGAVSFCRADHYPVREVDPLSGAVRWSDPRHFTLLTTAEMRATKCGYTRTLFKPTLLHRIKRFLMGERMDSAGS